ncbi:MAG TPA: LysR family transcriptional regulator [Solirubrobacteraceae bacterium]|nr:LysR family transcriptional regulator [Solirubrobacteraceae bacterium]
MHEDRADPISGGELAAFVLAVETGTVSAAAEALQMTQSAVSKRLQLLERRLEATLLERGRFGVRATEAGQLLYPEAKQALVALRHAAAVVAEHTKQAPTLHLAASHTIGGYLLPGWIAGFRLREPGPQRAQVEIVNSQGVLALIRDGAFDVGFVESTHSLEGLSALTICRDEIVAVVAPTHRWAGRRVLPAHWLASEPFVTREIGSGTRAVATQALAGVGVDLSPTLETASTQSLKRAVLDGGFTLISRLAVEVEERAGALCALAVSGVDLTRPLRAVRRRRASHSLVAERFWRYLATFGDREGAAGVSAPP